MMSISFNHQFVTFQLLLGSRFFTHDGPLSFDVGLPCLACRRRTASFSLYHSVAIPANKSSIMKPDNIITVDTAQVIFMLRWLSSMSHAVSHYRFDAPEARSIINLICSSWNILSASWWPSAGKHCTCGSCPVVEPARQVGEKNLVTPYLLADSRWCMWTWMTKIPQQRTILMTLLCFTPLNHFSEPKIKADRE